MQAATSGPVSSGACTPGREQVHLRPLTPTEDRRCENLLSLCRGATKPGRIQSPRDEEYNHNARNGSRLAVSLLWCGTHKYPHCFLPTFPFRHASIIAREHHFKIYGTMFFLFYSAVGTKYNIYTNMRRRFNLHTMCIKVWHHLAQ